MEHSLKTYLRVDVDGEFADAAEKLLGELTDNYERTSRGFTAGYEDEYNVDVNVLLRKTLGDFFGSEQKLKSLQAETGAYIALEIVAEIAAGSGEVKPLLSPDRDIIEFLYQSGADIDLDYYII